MNYDVIIIGGGVIGASVAYHLTLLGAKKVLLLEQDCIGSGTTSQSSGILRTHYSIRSNVEMAAASWNAFNRFPEYVQDESASCGLVKCGYMIAASDQRRKAALQASLLSQQELGIDARALSAADAREILPIAQFNNGELIGYEPEAGFADAYLVTTSFVRAAKRGGAKVIERARVYDLIRDRDRIIGVRSTNGDYGCDMVVSAQNVWTSSLCEWLGLPIPIKTERHIVITLQGSRPYHSQLPVFKDLNSPSLLYYRSYGGGQMLASEGTPGEEMPTIDTAQGEVALEYVGEVGDQIAQRFPDFATAGLAASWTGLYDVTLDWNPVLGDLPGVTGLTVGFGFSGHGFKLSPIVGKLLAQHALGRATDISLTPYSFLRFQQSALLVSRYGAGAVS